MIKKALIVLLGILFITGALLYTPDISIENMKSLYSDEDSRFVNIHGMDVHYKIEGSGMPIVLLHGTGSSLHTWDAWTAELTSHYKVVRLDLPAYGLTGPRPDRDYTMDKNTEFLNEFLTQLGIDSFHLGGNSFGGLVSFLYAHDFPEKVDKLILIDAAGFPTNDVPAVFKLAQNPLAAAILKKVTPKSFIRKNIEEVYANDELVTDKLVDRYHAMAIREGNRQAFIDRTKIPRERHDEQLKNIEEHTLIMWGAEDEWTPVENAKRFDMAIPNSQVLIYPNVGHVPMEESPDQTVEDLIEFLKE